jgi:hypothetical protein
MRLIYYYIHVHLLRQYFHHVSSWESMFDLPLLGISESAMKLRRSWYQHIYVVCRSSRLLWVQNPSEFPKKATPEAMDFFYHKIFISTRKSFLTLLYKLRKGFVPDLFIWILFTLCIPQTRMQTVNIKKNSSQKSRSLILSMAPAEHWRDVRQVAQQPYTRWNMLRLQLSKYPVRNGILQHVSPSPDADTFILIHPYTRCNLHHETHVLMHVSHNV